MTRTDVGDVTDVTGEQDDGGETDDTTCSDLSYMDARRSAREHGSGPFVWCYKKTDLPVGPHAPLEFSRYDDPHKSMSLAPGETLPRRGRRGGSNILIGSRPRGKHLQPRKMTRHELEVKRLENVKRRDPAAIPRDIKVGRRRLT